MRSLFFMEPTGLTFHLANPYGAVLAQAMTHLGVELVAGDREQEWDEQWLVENRQKFDVLHLHWPHYHYDTGDLEGSLARCTQFISYLSKARALGYKVVWTMHNFYPHESTSRELDRLARLAITQLASALIVHCNYAKDLIREHFNREEGVFVIPHGHFIDVYPNTISRSQARQRLNLPTDNFIYLYFGNIRPYKGVEHLVTAFSKLPDDDATLLFAGKVYTAYGETLAKQLEEADPRVVVRPSPHIPLDDLQLYLNAADVVALPFQSVLTSGSAITALGFSRPVIMPAIGCLPELIDDSMGILYDPQQPDALEKALGEIRQRDMAECSDAAYRHAQSLSWDKIAHQVLEVYQY
ncbi:MAG: glycosyltransferase [Chloroflexota bacterium]